MSEKFDKVLLQSASPTEQVENYFQEEDVKKINDNIHVLNFGSSILLGSSLIGFGIVDENKSKNIVEIKSELDKEIDQVTGLSLSRKTFYDILVESSDRIESLKVRDWEEEQVDLNYPEKIKNIFSSKDLSTEKDVFTKMYNSKSEIPDGENRKIDESVVYYSTSRGEVKVKCDGASFYFVDVTFEQAKEVVGSWVFS